MFVIVEGPDNSGKTALCKFLSMHLKVSIVHSGGPPRSKKEFFDRIERLLHHPRPVIFDRFPVISEHVYGPVLRGVDTFEGAHRIFNCRMLLRRPIILYCRTSIEEMLKLDDHKVKEHETAEHVESVKHNALNLIYRYDEVMSIYPSALRFDYLKDGDDFLSLLLMYLREVYREGWVQEKGVEELHG